MKNGAIVAVLSVVLVGFMGVWAMGAAMGETKDHCKADCCKYSKAALCEQLKLTPEQKAKVDAIKTAHKDEMIAVKRELLAKKKALCDVAKAENADPVAIRKAADDLGKVIGKKAVLKSGVWKEVRPILTKEQLDMVQKFYADKHAAAEARLLKCATETKAAPK